MRNVLFGALLTVLAASAATAEAVKVGVGAGYVDPSNIGGTVWLTGGARFNVSSNVVLEPELSFSKTGGVQAGSVRSLAGPVIDLHQCGALYLTYSPPSGVRVQFTVTESDGAACKT